MSTSAELGPDVTRSLGYLLKHAHHLVDAAMTRALAPWDIDPRALGVLRLVAGREPTSQQEIARALGVDRTTMVALLDALERQGFVVRRSDTGDRRRNVLELTGPGAEAFARADEAAREAEQEVLAVADGEDAAGLLRALHVIVTGAP